MSKTETTPESIDAFVNRRVKEILGCDWMWRDVSAKKAAVLQAEEEYKEGRDVRRI